MVLKIILFDQRDIQLSGRARLVLRPTLGQVPFIGGLQLCFLDEPTISFDMDGLANICDWPGIRRKVIMINKV